MNLPKTRLSGNLVSKSDPYDIPWMESWSGPNTPSKAPGNTVSVTVTYSYPLNIPWWPQSGTSFDDQLLGDRHFGRAFEAEDGG
jgi:hypothetical protein